MPTPHPTILAAVAAALALTSMEIPLPVDQSYSGTGVAFGITQTGSGPAARFENSDQNNHVPALEAVHRGEGIAARFLLANTYIDSIALIAKTAALGPVALFEQTNPQVGSTAVQIIARGTAGGLLVHADRGGAASIITRNAQGGPALRARMDQGQGNAAFFSVDSHESIHPALRLDNVGLGNAASFETINRANDKATVLARSNGRGFGGAFLLTNSANSVAALFSKTAGTGFAGAFEGTRRGVRITTTGALATGLQVVGGTKNAVVSTTTGARALYTEEATEVWFTDYGFGRLQAGRARILIDPMFAQTVNLEQPYHVFVQPYGPAELYVEARTNLGFVVRVKDGDPNTEFGYRIVGKRKEFESARLERASWADDSPGLRP